MQESSKVNGTAQPKPRVTVRKIGRTTFIVSSRFSESKKRDPAAAIARLIRYDADQTGKTS
ncbi:MAG: transposon-encoded TnpW family protein [Oscillospiraceae bacterium]|jgi:hypothetical protein|nr:transposon-encoded TnpW family protein [Oscillospiraceae bacterium]MCI2036161.1 transposon-encoded TnpW family protein [Oscillospiraceae bacterium]